MALHGMEWVRHLTTRDPIWRSIPFDRVTVCGRFLNESPAESRPLFSLLPTCYSDYESGPSLLLLAEVAAVVLGRGGYFGLESCRRVAV